MVIIATGNTPLPIPNREVKTVCADGTAICGSLSQWKTRLPNWIVIILLFLATAQTLDNAHQSYVA